MKKVSLIKKRKLVKPNGKDFVSFDMEIKRDSESMKKEMFEYKEKEDVGDNVNELSSEQKMVKNVQLTIPQSVDFNPKIIFLNNFLNERLDIFKNTAPKELYNNIEAMKNEFSGIFSKIKSYNEHQIDFLINVFVAGTRVWEV